MRADYGESDCSSGGPDEEMVEVRCILRVPGEPDRETVARMPRRAVPKSKGRRK